MPISAAVTLPTLRNRARGSLSAARSIGGVSLVLQSGEGAEFGSPSALAPLRIACRSITGTWIHFDCTARSSDTLTIVATPQDTAYGNISSDDITLPAGSVVVGIESASHIADLWNAHNAALAAGAGTAQQNTFTARQTLNSGLAIGSRTLTASGALTDQDAIVYFNSASAQTYTLPGTPASGQIFRGRNINTGMVTIDGAGTDIDFVGSQTYVLFHPGDSVTLHYNTTAAMWFSIGASA